MVAAGCPLFTTPLYQTSVVDLPHLWSAPVKWEGPTLVRRAFDLLTTSRISGWTELNDQLFGGDFWFVLCGLARFQPF
jgi:hypothetical protein